MCFSAVASFASGAVVGGVGIATLMKVRHAREVALGALPLLFAIHQLEEGLVWLGIEARISADVEVCAEWLYILYAHALLPVLIPLAFWSIEPKPVRRRALVPLLLLGLGLAAFALVKLPGGQITAQIRHHSIEYIDPVTGRLWFALLYVAVTCTPPFLSSFPWMVAFGALNLAALIVTAIFKTMFLTSIWCAMAATISVLVYLHFRWLRHQPGESAR